MVCVHITRGNVLCCCEAVTQITKVLKTRQDSLVAWVCTYTKRVMVLSVTHQCTQRQHQLVRKGHPCV